MVYIIRHGDHEHNSLTSLGQTQADFAGLIVTHNEPYFALPTQILVSPQKRAQETAKRIHAIIKKAILHKTNNSQSILDRLLSEPETVEWLDIGKPAAHDIIQKKIRDNVICLIITHAPQITEMEAAFRKQFDLAWNLLYSGEDGDNQAPNGGWIYVADQKIYKLPNLSDMRIRS